MEKLSIREASERFGLSRARLYKLLEKGAVAGFRSNQKGKAGGSWIDKRSLCEYVENTDEKRGRKQAVGHGNYLSVRQASEKTGYSIRQLNHLAKLGAITARKDGFHNLIYYPSLLKYIENKINSPF
jgi:hypothetical protein